MKFSEAVIKGYSEPRINGKQCAHVLESGDRLSVFGAANMGHHGSSDYPGWGNSAPDHAYVAQFRKAVGVCAAELNNNGMDWRDIVGISIAEGL